MRLGILVVGASALKCNCVVRRIDHDKYIALMDELAIINSVASLAGIAAPVVTGALIQNVSGARGFELGFALCGALMVGGGLLGLGMIDPGRSVRYAT